MSNLLGPDSKFYAALSALTDLVILNALFLLTSWPLITVGASARAAMVVAKQMAAEEGSSRVRLYLRELPRNWKNPTIWWLFLAVVELFVAYELYAISHAQLGSAGLVLSAGAVSGLLIVLGIAVWVWAICGWQDTPLPFRQVSMQAVIFAFRYLPRTALAVGALSALPLALYFVPSQWPALIVYFLLVGNALPMYLMALIVSPVVDAETARDVN